MIWLMTAWAFVKRWWIALAAIAGAVAVGLLKIRWTAAGRASERADQAERNNAARKEASDARDRALGADDPRGELLRRFRRSDGQ